jgi:hypothetical protein
MEEDGGAAGVVLGGEAEVELGNCLEDGTSERVLSECRIVLAE